MNCQSHLYRGLNPTAVSRRWFLQQCGVGLGSIALGALMQQSGWAAPSVNPMAAKPPHFKPKAKRVIYLFQNGAPSHVDLFDYKPKLKKLHGTQIPDEVVGGRRFSTMTGNQTARPVLGEITNFKQHGRSGAWVSDFLPRTAAIVAGLLQTSDRYTRMQLSTPTAMKRAEREHAELIRRTQKRDVKGACALLERHIETVRKDLLRILAQPAAAVSSSRRG